MSLVRCPGCKLDTSDSLAHCPNCGTALSGSGPKLFEQRVASVEPRPAEPAIAFPDSAPSTPRVSSAGWGQPAKAIAIFVVLLLLAFVPHAFPLLVVAMIFWQLAKRRKSGKPSPQMEALKIFVSEMSRTDNRSTRERPLDALRRIEQRLKKGTFSFFI